jgi:hypothetical protein
MPFLKNECTYSMELQGAEHPLTPSLGDSTSKDESPNIHVEAK